MCVDADGTIPQFYQSYVKQVQGIIQNNARLEFEAIWRENEETGTARSVLSDRLSTAITKMDEELQGTELWDNVELRRSVLSDALPNLLLEQIGLDKILERVSLTLCVAKEEHAANVTTGSGQLSPSNFRQLPCQPIHLYDGYLGITCELLCVYE